ncbi:hypothetical protein [Bradyrhizobium sp. AZCC 2230]|uniref:hypothetical protein n=1 Tax=Bradyrhizobium sp. AZCC 2230 TaxID=3117021 RepID=UPI002FF07BAC
MTASTPVERVAEILASAGYRRVATPLNIAGLKFDLPTAFVGISPSPDLILVADTAFEDEHRILKKIESIARAMDRITASGSRAEFICGIDHLTPRSNQIFRYTYSLGDAGANTTDLNSVLEGREEFNSIGFPDGSWEVRLRDTDPLSNSYGALLRATAAPTGDNHTNCTSN